MVTLCNSYKRLCCHIVCILHSLKSAGLAESACQQISYTWHTDEAFKRAILNLQKVTIFILNQSWKIKKNMLYIWPVRKYSCLFFISSLKIRLGGGHLIWKLGEHVPSEDYVDTNNNSREQNHWSVFSMENWESHCAVDCRYNAYMSINSTVVLNWGIYFLSLHQFPLILITWIVFIV